MTTSKTDAEIEWLKSTLVPEIFKNKNFQEDYGLQDFINDQVKLHKIEVKFIGAEEAFMLTSCYRALITFEQGDSGQRTSNLIVKRTPNLPQDVYDTLNFGSLFSNEFLAYNTIIPALESFSQQSINVPRLYYGDLGKNNAAIVLQDFDVGNWRLAKQKANLSLGHALVAMGCLGTFHGLGFALRHKDRAEFERITKDLKESRYAKKIDHPIFNIITTATAERLVIATQKYQPHIDFEFLERFKRLISLDFTAFGRQMVKPVEPFVTLCHGDYLRNNIAFKYSKDNEDPNEALIFDLQTMRLCSPMFDFVTFLSLSCFAAVRYEHFDEIFDEYYSQLTKKFKESTQVTELPDFLSRETLLSEYRRYLPIGISAAVYFLMQLVEPYQLTPEEYLTREEDPEETRKDVMARGGEVVDRELAHQVKELYEFVQNYNLDIFKGFDYV